MEEQLYTTRVESKKRHEYLLARMYERFGRMMMIAAYQRRKHAYKMERRQSRRKVARSLRGGNVLGAGSY